MSETFATARHQSPAVSPPKGGDEISRYVCAPRAVSWVRSASTFARYCALPGDHGVCVAEPNSSFSAINGVWQPVCLTAASNSLFATSTIVAGSAGASGVPTREASLRSNKIVDAPPARSCVGRLPVPGGVAMTSPGRANTCFQKGTVASV